MRYENSCKCKEVKCLCCGDVLTREKDYYFIKLGSVIFAFAIGMFVQSVLSAYLMAEIFDELYIRGFFKDFY